MQPTTLIKPSDVTKARNWVREHYKKDDHIEVTEKARVYQTDDDGLWVVARIFVEFGKF